LLFPKLFAIFRIGSLPTKDGRIEIIKEKIKKTNRFSFILPKRKNQRQNCLAGPVEIQRVREQKKLRKKEKWKRGNRK